MNLFHSYYSLSSVITNQDQDPKPVIKEQPKDNQPKEPKLNKQETKEGQDNKLTKSPKDWAD